MSAARVSAAGLQALQLQLLGPARLLLSDKVIHVGSRKALALLALLALDNGATRERLTELLWPEAPVAAGRRNLRREVFRLRQLGVPIEEVADCALALGGALAVDALQLLRQALPSDDTGMAMEGLDGVGSAEFDAWLQHWRERLSQRQAVLLASAAERAENQGDLALALTLSTRLWAADVCNEPSALQVMRLHAALGQRSAALQAYRRLADALRHELEIEPSAAAQDLAKDFAQNLAHSLQPHSDPADVAIADARAPDAVPPTTLPASAWAAPRLPALVPFIPRLAAQHSINAAWSRGQRVYLHGPAGTGKTRLASELAAARGPWLRVACEPQDQELPYSSVVRLLRALRESACDTVLPDWVRRELAQVMPELGPAALPLATDEARQRLLAGVAHAWRLLMHDNFSVLILDDWHWGDAASVELWSRLDDTGAAASAAVAWIIAYRSAQLPPPALERQRADVDSQRGVVVALEGMDEAEVLALTHALSGAQGGRLFAQRLHGATEGNPFFLLETVRHLFEQGLLVADATGWSTPFDEQTQDYAELPIPVSVRQTVLARVHSLGSSVQRLLEVASLAGAEIEPRLLATLGDVDEEAAVAVLEHAQAAQLVHETRAGWRFSHDLVRLSLAHGLSSGRRRLLHERLAQGLEQQGAKPALIAVQWEAAQRPAQAVRWRMAAGAAALRVHAFTEALASYAQALANGAQGQVAAAIHLACARVHHLRTDRVAANAAFANAVSAAASAPLASPADVLKLQLAQAEHLCQTDRGEDGLAALDALAPEIAAAAPELRAKALAVRGAGLMYQNKFTAAEAVMQQALALFECLSQSRAELAALLLNLARSSNWRGDTEAFGRYARRAVAVHESVDDAAGLAKSLSLQARHHKVRGENEQALAFSERARALAAHSGNVPAHRNAIFGLIEIHMNAGHTDEVLRLLDEGEALAPGFENHLIEQNFQAARFYVHFLRGEVAQARAAGQRLLAVATRSGNLVLRVGYLLMVADLSIDTGDLSGARRLVDEAQAASDAHRASGDEIWFSTNLANKHAALALADGRPGDALALLKGATSDDVDDRFHCAWLGAAAARALGDAAGARRRLDAVGIDEGAPTHPLVCWLAQRLALAADEGRADAPAVERAQALLDQRRVPALLIERLRRALDAVPR